MANDNPYKLFTVERDGKSLKLKEKQLAIMFSLREEVCFSHLNSAHLVSGLQLWVNVLWFPKGHDWVFQAFNNLL